MKSFSTLIFISTSLFILTLQSSFAQKNKKPEKDQPCPIKYCSNVINADLKSTNYADHFKYIAGQSDYKGMTHCLVVSTLKNEKGIVLHSITAAPKVKKGATIVKIKFKTINDPIIYTYQSNPEICIDPNSTSTGSVNEKNGNANDSASSVNGDV